MRLTHVGHAGAVVEEGGVVLLIDPWLRGRAFNDGWTAWPDAELDDALADRVTHLWISHEHPDHLSVPTLRAIPEDRRARTTVLYQRHWQPEVAAFLRTLGFAEVVELDHARPCRLDPDVSVTLFQVGHEDSALLVEGGGHRVLDLNDCKPSPGGLRRLAAAVGPVDVLLDQFSIAGWPGNPDDHARHRAAGARALATFRSHVEALRPRWTVPFASFVRFAHEENAWMNAVANPVDAAVDAVGPERTAVLYPGDRWDLATGFDGTADALDRYAEAEATLESAPLTRHASEPVDEVVEAAAAWVDQVASSYHTALRRRVEPVAFAFDDHGTAFVVDVAAATVHEAADAASTVHCSSQVGRFTFTERWGVPTLLISGRFRLSGSEASFRRFKQLGSAYSTGITTRGLARTVGSRRLAGVAWQRRRDLAGDAAGRLRVGRR